MSPASRTVTARSSRSLLPLFSIYEDSVVTVRGSGGDNVYKTVFEHKRSTDK